MVASHAGIGGVTLPGQSWWTGSFGPLTIPADPHRGDNGEFRVRLPAEPAAVQDRNSLRRTLLQQSWTLDFSSAQWIVAAGIGNCATGLADHDSTDQDGSHVPG